MTITDNPNGNLIPGKSFISKLKIFLNAVFKKGEILYISSGFSLFLDVTDETVTI